jgi:hypothetical protein
MGTVYYGNAEPERRVGDGGLQGSCEKISMMLKKTTEKHGVSGRSPVTA